jgi:hypothetical protein
MYVMMPAPPVSAFRLCVVNVFVQMAHSSWARIAICGTDIWEMYYVFKLASSPAAVLCVYLSRVHTGCDEED